MRNIILVEKLKKNYNSKIALDVEVCEAVTEMKEDSDMIKFKKIAKVETAACVLHKGSYSDFPKAYDALLPRNHPLWNFHYFR